MPRVQYMMNSSILETEMCVDSNLETPTTIQLFPSHIINKKPTQEKKFLEMNLSTCQAGRRRLFHSETDTMNTNHQSKRKNRLGSIRLNPPFIPECSESDDFLRKRTLTRLTLGSSLYNLIPDYSGSSVYEKKNKSTVNYTTTINRLESYFENREFPESKDVEDVLGPSSIQKFSTGIRTFQGQIPVATEMTKIHFFYSEESFHSCSNVEDQQGSLKITCTISTRFLTN
ncbi:hypothetical protein WA158_001497 [Blastocystis sp. Blastoise]